MTWKYFFITSGKGSLAAASTTALASVHPWVEYKNDVPATIHAKQMLLPEVIFIAQQKRTIIQTSARLSLLYLVWT
jgi:hypothetical protein